MFPKWLTRSGGQALLCMFLLWCPALAQVKPDSNDEIPLWKFDEMTTPGSCRMMGRFQDKKYCDSRIVDLVLALGKDAIPVLISELTDTRKTKHPVYDLWKYTAAGDIANSLLLDLFTTPDLRVSVMPDLDIECSKPGETCWRKFLRKKGRKFVQEQWQTAWEANKDHIYWDDKARCFKLSTQPFRGELVGNVSTTVRGSRQR
jgi:hypothetical protein